MKALDAAIKRETRGERIRWQAEPKVRRSLGGAVMVLLGSRPPPLARPVYVLTDSRLLALEMRGEQVSLRDIPTPDARSLMARWHGLTEAERATPEARLLQEIVLLCPTGAVNTLKRTLAGARR